MSNDLLSAYQFGFLKGRSTTLQLLKVLNDWTESMESVVLLAEIITNVDEVDLIMFNSISNPI